MKAKRKILIVQLNRFGDLVQTQMAVEQMVKENPDFEFQLIARKKFAKQLDFMLSKVFKKTHLLDSNSLFLTKNLKDAKIELSSFLNTINTERFDTVVNLSFCKSSGYLSTLINAKQKLGLNRNRTNQVVIEDSWSQFLYSTVMSGHQNPFNLVELFGNILGVKEHTRLQPKNKESQKIVIHPFASNIKKRWKASKWVEVIYKVLKDNPLSEIFVVGAKQDLKDSERIKSHPSLCEYSSRLHFATNLLSIHETYKLLEESSLFLGHDSMVSHLAAYAEVQTVTISLGTVRAHETTPYIKGAVNLVPKSNCFPCEIARKCDLHSCHGDINTQAVALVASNLLKKDSISFDKLSEKLSTFHLMNTSIYQLDLDKDSNYKLLNILSNETSAQDAYKDFNSFIWNYYLSGKENYTAIPKVNKTTYTNLNHNQEGISYLYELYSFASKFAKQLSEEAKNPSPSSEVINNLIAKLNEVDQLCNITKQNYINLAPIVDFFFVKKSNVQGITLKEISENYLLSYFDASNVCAMYHELIEQTTSPFKTNNKAGVDL